MDSFTGEIRVFGFGFAPQDWAFCSGQTMPVNQNPALYSVIGNYYGGTAGQSFMLPNIQGRVPVGVKPSAAPQVGVRSGSETVAVSGLPVHNHTLNARTIPATTAALGNFASVPTGTSWLSTCVNKSGASPEIVAAASLATSPDTTLAGVAIGPVGSASVQAHENRQPFLAMNFCISLYGEYPMRP